MNKSLDETINKMLKEIEEKNFEYFDREKVIQQLVLQHNEIERLNNIINELEKWLNDVMEVLYSFKELDVWDNAELKTLKQVLNKLKELKENK